MLFLNQFEFEQQQQQISRAEHEPKISRLSQCIQPYAGSLPLVSGAEYDLFYFANLRLTLMPGFSPLSWCGHLAFLLFKR